MAPRPKGFVCTNKPKMDSCSRRPPWKVIAFLRQHIKSATRRASLSREDEFDAREIESIGTLRIPSFPGPFVFFAEPLINARILHFGTTGRNHDFGWRPAHQRSGTVSRRTNKSIPNRGRRLKSFAGVRPLPRKRWLFCPAKAPAFV